MISQSNPKANYLAHRVSIDVAIAKVLESGWYILGQEVAAFETEFAAAMGASWAVGVATGTDAIEMALRALGVASGDGVLTVSHTAVATVAAIARIGARPLFVDIDPQRFTMDPLSLRAALATPQGRGAKALVVVHLYGQAADMPAILEMARGHGLAVVEDCAQAHGATLHGRLVGTWGDLGCFSFYPTKNLGALGDGGAVVGADSVLEGQVRRLREYGWRTRYISEDFGLNSRLDELQAAILRVKLPHLATENARRRAIARHYDRGLADSSIRIPVRFPDCEHVFHQYVIQTGERDELRKALGQSAIGCLVHYPQAVHQQPAFSEQALRPVPLPHTETVVERILSLPMYPELRDDEADQVGEALRRYCFGS
jgi:dTDP-4-amino-4,6-dideoxygalactose transaminase